MTRLAVENLKADNIPEQHKRDLLQGKVDPVVVTPEGEFATPVGVINKRLRDARENDAVLAFERADAALVKLQMFQVKAIVAGMDHDRVHRLIEEVPTAITFLQGVLAEARAARKPRVVS